jgi:hypothetical protein
MHRGRAYSAPNITVIKLRTTNEAEQRASKGNMKNAHKILIQEPKENRHLVIPMRRQYKNSNTDLKIRIIG